MSTKVSSVATVEFAIEKSNPAILKVSASGKASTPNWTNPELTPAIYIVQPPDGIQDFSFVAEPPSGTQIQLMTPIEGQGETEMKNWILGVRVNAATNSVVVMF